MRIARTAPRAAVGIVNTAGNKDDVVPSKRYAIRLGEPLPDVAVRTIPADENELLARAMALLEELDDADFVPEEFEDEVRALRRAWAR